MSIIYNRFDGYLKVKSYYDSINKIVISQYDDVYDEIDLHVSIQPVYQYFRLNKKDKYLLDLRKLITMKDDVLDYYENIIFKNLKEFGLKKIAVLGRSDIINHMKNNYKIAGITEIQIFYEDYNTAIKWLKGETINLPNIINVENHC